MKKLLSLLALSALLVSGSALQAFVEVDIQGGEGACEKATCNTQKLEIVCPACPKTNVIPASFQQACWKDATLVPEQVIVTPAQFTPESVEVIPARLEPGSFTPAEFTPEQVTTNCPAKCAAKKVEPRREAARCNKCVSKPRRCKGGCRRGSRSSVNYSNGDAGYDFVEQM